VDIHPPHAVHSWKDFGVQLVTITAGILIALSLEGVRESIRDRALVREARENIHREIADNKREVDGELATMADRTRKIDGAMRFAHELLRTRHTGAHGQVELGLAFPTLSTASWQTAERTGALAHMDYAEVQKYAALYSFQEFLAAQHRRALDALSSTIGLLTASEDGDQTQALTDIARFRDQLVALRSVLFIEEQLARTASERYRKALE
jgi:hypothetical protein